MVLLCTETVWSIAFWLLATMLKLSTNTEPAQVNLDMRMLFVHGDEVIADSAENNQGFLKACAVFKEWIHEKWPKTAAA